MPPVTLAGKAFADTGGHAGAPGILAPAPVTRGHGPVRPGHCCPAALRAVPRPLPVTTCLESAGSTRAEHLGDRLRRVVGLLWPAPTTGASHHDPSFVRSDLVEHDYYRFRYQRPRLVTVLAPTASSTGRYGSTLHPHRPSRGTAGRCRLPRISLARRLAPRNIVSNANVRTISAACQPDARLSR